MWLSQPATSIDGEKFGAIVTPPGNPCRHNGAIPGLAGPRPAGWLVGLLIEPIFNTTEQRRVSREVRVLRVLLCCRRRPSLCTHYSSDVSRPVRPPSPALAAPRPATPCPVPVHCTRHELDTTPDHATTWDQLRCAM